MYQSYVFLELRILLSAVPGVFITQNEKPGATDILSAKADFQRKNNEVNPVKAVKIEPSALHKVVELVRALGSIPVDESPLEKLTGAIQDPPDDRPFTGFSVLVAHGGSLDIMFHQKAKRITIEEIRIEEDCGHLTHSGGGKARMDWTHAGCPCVRLRTGAVFEVGEEAEIFLRELYTLMAYLKLVAPEMGEASVRCNAYTALAEYPAKPDYEVKLRNLNSFNFVRMAINSELLREEELLYSGGKVASESRLWLSGQGSTESWKPREKDSVRFAQVEPLVEVPVAKGTAVAPIELELPGERRNRMRKQYGLSRLRAEFICAEKDRADFFEETVKCGSEALLTAHWMAGEFMKLLNKDRCSIRASFLTPEKFACILKMLSDGSINSSMAKSLMKQVHEHGDDPEKFAEENGMALISSEEELSPVVDEVLSENEASVKTLMNGDMAPLEFLTGCVMRRTGSRAVPQSVKKIIKEKLNIQIVYVFTMGGAFTAVKHSDGTVAAGNPESLRSLLDSDHSSVPVQITPVRSMLSEETEPADWARLVSEIKLRMESGTANGIVVTHGTDTLCYTAALLYWLFSASNVPIVLAASVMLPSDGDEARNTLNLALATAREKKGGVYVAFGGKLYSALNLKFLGGNSECGNENAFVNWGKDFTCGPKAFSSELFLSQQFLSLSSPDGEVMARILNEASSRVCVMRLYPGMPMRRYEDFLRSSVDIDHLVLELYASGTCNMRNSDFSVKTLMSMGKRKDMKIYCTSQQECAVDFSEYTTAARVWREGVVPMGFLTTESVVALFFAASLIADSDEELNELMESALDELKA